MCSRLLVASLDCHGDGLRTATEKGSACIRLTICQVDSSCSRFQCFELSVPSSKHHLNCIFVQILHPISYQTLILVYL